MIDLPTTGFIVYSLIITVFSVAFSALVMLLSIARRVRINRTQQITPDFTQIAQDYQASEKRITQTTRTIDLAEVDESEQFVISIKNDEDTQPEASRYHNQKHIVDVMKNRAQAKAG